MLMAKAVCDLANRTPGKDAVAMESFAKALTMVCLTLSTHLSHTLNPSLPLNLSVSLNPSLAPSTRLSLSPQPVSISHFKFLS